MAVFLKVGTHKSLPLEVGDGRDLGYPWVWPQLWRWGCVTELPKARLRANVGQDMGIVRLSPEKGHSGALGVRRHLGTPHWLMGACPAPHPPWWNQLGADC